MKSMKVKITKPSGAFTDEGGYTINPAVGQTVEVSRELGSALVEAGKAEEIKARKRRASGRAKLPREAGAAENTVSPGPEETRG